ncbi:cell migration-inducing and hyaluronan-binding protein-like [Ylistrum balloti]|uniref:cell migration-inducing and hyaluronan-binding protein-like n=1 Tax=Ylistrum balloti TaxID=509963 RepID=UPI00290588F9|nr:cell migration-inducing and hyaluronan-binding protein-like [Ylistrum balloti]
MCVQWSLAAAIFCLHIFLVAGQDWCPHENPSLIAWSDTGGTWGGEVFDSYSNVTVTADVLLDTDIDVFSITIASGASLVWSPAAEPRVRVRYILVYGSLIIGSEDCPFTNYTHISFVGAPGAYSIPDFDEKFLGVAAGGTLEVHGENRIGWTKLDNTIEKCDKGDCLYFNQRNDLSKTDISKYQPGLIVTVLDETTGLPIKYTHIRLDSNKQNKITSNVNLLKTFMNDVQDGRVVAMEVQRYLPGTDMSLIEAAGLFDYIETLADLAVTNQMDIRNVEKYDAYSLVFVKGNINQKQERLTKQTSPATDQALDSVSVIVENGYFFKAHSHVDGSDIKNSYVNVVSANFSLVEFVIDLLDDVSLWRAGDVVVVTSTDFDWTQAEYAYVIDCPNCLPNQIKVEMIAEYTHYGEVYMNTDMRAEVALLTRNIVFEGFDNDGGNDNTFGGHLKFLKDFENVHIEGAEFFHMGHKNFPGRYPINFHMCEDVDTGTNPPYIRSNSIHHNYARCVTIRGTNGVKVEDNVCFDCYGHAYFLEDGGEKRTVFDGNLGFGQRSTSTLVQTDINPVAFFISNPQTYLRNNVAAGGWRAGFWFVFPNEPIGESTGLGFMAVDEAKHTAIYEFYNNVAHSYNQAGLLIDSILKPDGKTSGNNNYEPWNDPFNSRSGAKEVKLLRFTGYKNRLWNAYISGGYITLEESSFSDSSQGVYFERGSYQWKSVARSVFLGDSLNVGEPSPGFNRSRPIDNDLNSNVQGFVFNEGPIKLRESWFGDFGDFEDNTDYKSMGIGFQPRDNGDISPRSTTEEVLFGYDDPYGLRVFDGNASTLGYTDTDTDLVSAFIDKDGTLTTQSGNSVVKPLPFHLTDSCITNDRWGLSVCPYNYAQLMLSYSGSAVATMTRDDDPSLSYSDDGSNNARFLVMRGYVTSYILNFDAPMPKTFTIKTAAIDNAGGVRIGVCIPRNANLELKINKPKKANKIKKWQSVSTLQEVDDDTVGAKYYLDTTVGIVFFKLFHNQNIDEDQTTDCPKGVCTTAVVKIKRGDLSDSDCTARAYAVYNRTIDFPPVPSSTFAPFPLDRVTPPEVWGAGPTRHGMFDIIGDVFD